MVTSDMLLHLIADLQSDMTLTHGRRTLLKYAQTSSGARLALLFVYDKEHQILVLLERCGRRPQRPQHPQHQQHQQRLRQEPLASLAAAPAKRERFNTRRISAQGL